MARFDDNHWWHRFELYIFWDSLQAFGASQEERMHPDAGKFHHQVLIYFKLTQALNPLFYFASYFLSQEIPKKIETETQLLPTNGFQRPHSVSNVNSKYLPDHHYTTFNNIKVASSQPTLITKNRIEHGVKSFGSGIMNRRDIFYQGSVDNLRKQLVHLN